MLVVADCDGLEETLKDLRRHGLAADAAESGTHAMTCFRDFNVVLIDLDFKDFDGLTLCREIRNVSDIPIIGFASCDSTLILALEAGCDDCVEKPYPVRKLVARVGALLRRARLSTAAALVRGELSIHPATRLVRVGDRLLDTTRKEFDLLYLLASAPGKVFSREELLRRIWEYDVNAEVTPLASRTIDTHVSSLRRKMGTPNSIVTVRGVGFRFTGDGPQEPPATDCVGVANPAGLRLADSGELDGTARHGPRQLASSPP